MTPGRGPPDIPTVGVVSVGDELLLGETVDTNGSWLARELSALGFRVRGRWVVGDGRVDIQAAVEKALDKAEVVLVTGGLGPTPDDVTRESVADLLGLSLAPDAGIMALLRARMGKRGFDTLPENARAMALVPVGGKVLPNSLGAAPGLAMETGRRSICILLPGVPREMKEIFRREVRPLLEGRFRRRLEGVVHRVIHTFGVPESILMARIQEVLAGSDALSGVSLAYLPDDVGVRLRLSSRHGKGREGALARILRVEALLDPVLAPHRFEADSGDLAEAVGAVLLRRGLTLAVAESCTSGLVAKRMTDPAGSSRYFLGGVVAYANEVKESLLGVSSALMKEEGVVSRGVAAAMALGVARRLGSDAGMGVTGIAGPGGGTREKPVGTVFFAASLGKTVVSRKEEFPGDRATVRKQAAQASLGLLLRLLEGRIED